VLARERLTEVIGGSPEANTVLGRELARIFLEDAERRVAELSRGDLAEPRRTRQLAHALKGAASNFGAERLAFLAERAEAASELGGAKLAAAVSPLAQSLADVRGALAELGWV
jgi:HPt (histidine-containing phosphotransfer) domain-containing protein